MINISRECGSWDECDTKENKEALSCVNAK